MSGRLLDFKQYIGGADNVITLEAFPRDEKVYSYQFGTDVSSYTFSADYQSLLLDNVTYDRQTGLPNFAETNVIGYFDNYTEINNANFTLTDAINGIVVFKIPAERYTGAIFPNARTNVVATVVSFQWDTTTQGKNTHRYLILERWEPGVTSGNPQYDALFREFGVGAVNAFTDNAAPDATRDAANVEGVYNNVTGITNGEGSGAAFQAIIAENGDIEFNLVSGGTGYNVNDTITILDTSLGGAGAQNITITVTSVR